MTQPGTPLASNLFGGARTTRSRTGYEPRPASEEEEAPITPYVHQPQQPEYLGGIRPFNPDALRALLQQGPRGALRPMGPSSSDVPLAPALPLAVRPVQGSNRKKRDQSQKKRGLKMHETCRTGLDGQTRAQYPTKFPFARKCH